MAKKRTYMMEILQDIKHISKNRQVHNISEILPQKLSYYEHTNWDYY